MKPRRKKRASVLIIEDRENWREHIRTILEREGYGVAVSSSASEARKLANQSHFDLAVVDLRLDDSDPNNYEGLNLLYEFSVRPGHVDRAIVLTGYATVPIAVRAMQNDGAIRFVEKQSFDPDTFRDLVDRSVSTRTLESDKAKYKKIFLAYEYQEKWQTRIGRELKNFIVSLDSSYSVYQVPEYSPGGNLLYRILDLIQQSDLSLFEITPNNPNVSFELGYAMGIGKPYCTLLDATIGREVPPILRGEVWAQYSTDGELFAQVIKVLRRDTQATKNFVFAVANKIRIPTKRRSALLLVPYEPDQQRIGDELERLLKKRFSVHRPNLERTSDLTGLYRQVIAHEIVVGSLLPKDWENASYLNSQVSFPLGIAFGKKKKVVVLQQGKYGPSDLTEVAHHYNGGVEEAIEQLNLALRESQLKGKPRVRTKCL